MVFTPEELKQLKGKGYIYNKAHDRFSCRYVVPQGRLTAAQSKAVAEATEQFGNGEYYFTQRLNLEIPWVAYEDLEALSKAMADVDLHIGGAGMRAKPVHTCKGTICGLNNYDITTYVKELNQRIYNGHPLPNKLRITLGGCGNNCSTPQLACIGIQGRKPNQAALYLGGLGGKRLQFGREVAGVHAMDQIVAMVERAVTSYAQHGQPMERFADYVARVGFKELEKELLANRPSTSG